MRKKYETDLTDEKWAEIEPLFMVKTGCQWRKLPHDFPPVFIVELWDRILQHMR